MSIKRWQIAGAIFTTAAGCLLHFVYAWSGCLPAVGLFCAVNESTWEHLKLLFTPFLLFAILEYARYGFRTPGFLPVKTLSVLIGMGVITAGFYTYAGILGRNWLPLDILVFIAGVLAAYSYSARRLSTGRFCSVRAVCLGWLGMAILLLCFVVFTATPPRIGLFLDPVTGGYGW